MNTTEFNFIPGKLYETYKNKIFMIFSIVFNKNTNLYEIFYSLDGKLNNFAMTLETIKHIHPQIKEIDHE